ncbi:hypothetical protein GBK02_11425 [Dechloromonas sp. TW-R-39-2]|uniref:hypothetical protein n=1 Tax=Dechloromonas TaxID=73029 RepID=UPI00193DBD57|nr:MULTISPECIES: hypothetical protein [Dechloromonas]QRM19969.1 hypothetical protein GBK02_11425 [Dechloromonas sp. TW-R-39-2]UCV10358.1 hypothetical protein KI614_09040 [Dechloromonas denitrificans]
MFRVLTKRFDHRDRWIVEAGPWHNKREDAEYWAELLRNVGYSVEVDAQHGLVADSGGNDELMDALSSMA